MAKQAIQKMYVVVTADNITSDIHLSHPFLDPMSASAYLLEQYKELYKTVFDGRELTEFDNAECDEESYNLQDSRDNDFYYGYVKEICTPVFNNASHLAYANLMALDAESRSRILSERIASALYEKSVDIDVTGKEVLEAIMANDINGLLTALTGCNATELLQSAHLCRNEGFCSSDTACNEPAGYVFGSHNDMPFSAEVTVDMERLCVTAIRMGEKEVQGAELCEFLDALEDRKLYLLHMKDAFALHREDHVPAGSEHVTYWYKKEA